MPVRTDCATTILATDGILPTSIQSTTDSIAPVLIYGSPTKLAPTLDIRPLPDNERMIAFDGDAVIFSDEAERVYQESGVAAFRESETAAAKFPLSGGPFKGFLAALHQIQNLLYYLIQEENNYHQDNLKDNDFLHHIQELNEFRLEWNTHKIR